MSATIRRYVALQEDFIDERGLTPAELKAAKLRMNFLKKFIIGFDTYIYKTQVERDWAYIAKRYCKDRTEYRYDVQLNGAAYSFATANVLWSWSIWRNKRMVWWPLALTPVFYQFYQPQLLKKHSKKLFDMCNIGEEYYLGRKRNDTLKLCNELLDREDF